LTDNKKDMSMPVVDGFEATRAIRQLEQTGLKPSIPASNGQILSSESGSRQQALIIALTGLASGDDREKAYKAGVDLFTTKPVKFGKLAELLAQWEEGKLVGGGQGDEQMS
jgi:CheY-like chemotaxis protein